MNTRCAAIDFGTNTARLLIGEREARRLKTVLIEREIIRLGGGFTDKSGLSSEAQQRGMNCLKRFSEIIQKHGVYDVRASATSAVRDAVNGRQFIDQVLHETGIQLTVIDGKREGELTLKGVVSGLEPQQDNIMVLDVGGGSTEITVAEKGVPRFVHSMPMGVIRLSEGFGSCESMSGRITAVLNELQKVMTADSIHIHPETELIGTAGTSTTLAAIQMKMEEYDYRKVNNFLISRTGIDEILERLIPLTPQERVLIPGLEKGREDLIIAGILITVRVMDLFGFKRLKVSDFGLLEGLALMDDSL